MAKVEQSQRALFQVAQLPGRPLLHWHGRPPLQGIPCYAAKAVIELADPKLQQAADGRKAIARAQKCGQRGEYGRAIQLYEEVLKALPAFQRQR